MLPMTTSIMYVGSLHRYNAKTALLQLTESTQNICCLTETDKSLSVLKVAVPSRHLPAYYVYLRKYVTKNIIRPTVHPKFLTTYVKPHGLFGNIGHNFLHSDRPVTRNVGEKSNYVMYTNNTHISLPTTKTGNKTYVYNSKWTKTNSKKYITNNYNAKCY